MVRTEEIFQVKSLRDLNRLIAKCRRCILYKTKICDVPGEGNKKAGILFIGEAPGKEEDKKGKPFVGRAGKFLDKLLSEIKLKRTEVFIANLVKHRPPQNRRPRPKELEACFPYLQRQIEIVNPKLIVFLGSSSFEFFFPKEKISRRHGEFLKKNNKLYLPLYHPVAAIYNKKLENISILDFKKIKEYRKIK